MRRNLELFVCLCFAMLLLCSSFFTHTVVADTPLSDQMEVHSWAELKRLYDASQKSNDEFLAEVAALDAECDCRHLYFELTNGNPNWSLRESFIEYYEQIAEQKVLVPKDTDTIQLKEVFVDSNGLDIITYSRYYQTKAGSYQFWTPKEGDYSASFNKYQKEPDDVIKGDGYSVHIWYECSEYGTQCYSGYYILDDEETPRFYMKLENSNNKESVPETCLPWFALFRVTTAEEMLAKEELADEVLPEAAPSRAWIWVVAGVAGAAILGTGVVLRKRRKTQAQQSE